MPAAYDAGLGRFLTVDPLLDTGEPRHANGYVYSYNSPVSYTDADGLQAIGSSDGPSKYNPGPPPRTGVAPSPNGGGGGTPPAAGNGGGGGGGGQGGGSPKPKQEAQWWEPWNWSHDQWVTAGEVALTTVAVAAIGACVVMTAGVCAAVGVTAGLVLAGSAAGTIGLAGYMLKDGPKTGEGALQAFNLNGLSGVAGLGIGMAMPAVAGAIAQSLEKALATAGTNAAPAAESAATTITREASADTLAGTNSQGLVTSRGSFRNATLNNAWQNAEVGANGGRMCPSCQSEVTVPPNTGVPRDWDASHNPSWTNRQFPPDVSRAEVLNNYNTGVLLECPSCNRAGGNNDGRFG